MRCFIFKPILIFAVILTPFLIGSLNEIIRDDMPNKGRPVFSNQLEEHSDSSLNHTWKNLFNGSNTEGWHKYNSSDSVNWIVKDGVLYTPGNKGDIVSDLEFENFELEVEWKIEPKSNSGIFYFVQESERYKWIWETGPEFQIIDDLNYPAKLLEMQKTGACSDVLPPTALASNPPGKWNSARILVMDGNVEHWLNDQLILEYSMNSEEWKSSVAESKFSELDYAKTQKGKIGLQDHGGPVYFRKIRIREL